MSGSIVVLMEAPGNPATPGYRQVLRQHPTPANAARPPRCIAQRAPGSVPAARRAAAAPRTDRNDLPRNPTIGVAGVALRPAVCLSEQPALVVDHVDEHLVRFLHRLPRQPHQANGQLIAFCVERKALRGRSCRPNSRLAAVRAGSSVHAAPGRPSPQPRAVTQPSPPPPAAGVAAKP